MDFFGFYKNIQISENIIIKNFPTLGLIKYDNEKLLYKFFPHFLSNFLSILLYNVIHFIYEKIDKKKNIIDDKNIDLDEISINKDDNSDINKNDKTEQKINYLIYNIN